MQELYTMLMNSGVSTIIVIFFLYKYYKEDIAKQDKNDDETKENSKVLKEILKILQEILLIVKERK